uniref:Uncharacterized protein n=1 Tax=Lepeophtheirus salmonis TaxID=72036 RepID=A0A0K2TC52_LEPSM
MCRIPARASGRGTRK